jgi:hypothetical protein
MAILDPADRIELLAIDGLRKFVEKEEHTYVAKLKNWKKELPKDAELANPRMLAASLAGYLRIYDENLRSLMWTIWRDNELRINKFYDIIGKYFVDCEAAT